MQCLSYCRKKKTILNLVSHYHWNASNRISTTTKQTQKNGPSRVGDVGKHIRWTERQRGKKGCSIEKSNKKSNTPLPPLNEPITISRVILSEGAPDRTDRTNAVEQYLRLLSATAIHGEMLRYLMKRTGGRTQPDRPSWPRGVWFEIMHECTITSRLSTFRLGRSSRV